MTEVTVIIPTRNRRALLARTLHAVLAQRGVDLSVIVVDDGSTDQTQAMVERLGDERVTVARHQSARGVSAARNTGIQMATSPWLAFVDDDDLWAPEKLRLQLHALSTQDSAQWSCTGAVVIGDQCRILGWSEPPIARDALEALFNINIIPGGGSGVVASRKLASQLGGFDEALSNLADWDFYIRLALTSPPVVVPLPLVGYYVHPGGMSNNLRLSREEHRYLLVKYASDRKSRGVKVQSEMWILHLANMAFSGRRRLMGTLLHLELILRGRRWRSLGSIAVGLAPRRLRIARARWSELNPPPGWAQEVAAWLPTYSSGWLD